MSKIQEALKRLQGNGSQSARPSRPLPETVIPIAKKKTVSVAGDVYKVDEQSLIKGGLLAPLEHARPIADQFRRVKRPLLDNIAKQRPNSSEHLNLIMVAGPLPGVGKTFCSVNLAASISLERELGVLLIDADVAKPHISKAFGLEDRPGLIELLEHDDMSVDEVLVRTSLNDIQVLPAGRQHAQSTELLASARMESLIDELVARFDDRVIIMDSPPLLITNEAVAVAKQAGQIALVVECGETAHGQLLETVEQLDSSKPINVILNKSTYTTSGGYYGGYGYYGFNEHEEDN